eukprot:TRINITY_DN6936_c0_g1_i2.p1 TRINITY_DN6936_c0_g1~~TRINITY_DN6936_c0_g1_i2.p1  ORF type:complete len:1039 (-),score=240.95 TRINITY_DN6936_c0_g1_i2:138-3254(-)
MSVAASKNSMRGLTVFISDIRNAQSKEGEDKRVQKELAHIRKEFKEAKNIDGYQRRKYVCKLLYIYMLGYDLDFGHMEAVTLLSANKFQEKSIGYLALGMLLHETHELIPLIINSLQEDLTSRADYFQCLALSAVANIGGKEMADSLCPTVQKLLVANTSPPHIKKRAAQSLFRLYRKVPSSTSADLWAAKIIGILDDPDIGVLTSSLSLLLGIATDSTAGWELVVPKAVTVLGKIVTGREYSKDYVYHSIPCPWLQVLIIRLLRCFPPPSDQALSFRLAEILTIIFNSADSGKAGNTNQKNALNAILFETIHLIIHYDGQTDQFDNLLRQTGSLLGRFLSAKETNIRYLGLEAMSHLASLSSEAANMVKKHQNTVVLSLRDADISIRRRALDLLYGMCDKQSSEAIVGELLTYLVTADYQIREELVVKIAALAEKLASNYSWYVDVILQLISSAGEHVSDAIWHRVVKIVTNHDDIQEYAAKTVFAALESSSCHETTVKVGGYILGEFGHLISEKPGSGPQEQFQLLHSKFPTVGLPTKALLLTTYVKMVNLYPELTRTVQEVFKQHQTSIDAEIQQRSCEYYQLSNTDENLMQSVLDVIPAWNEVQGDGEPARSNNNMAFNNANSPNKIPAQTQQRGKGNNHEDLLGLDIGNLSVGTGHVNPPNVSSNGFPGVAHAELHDPFGIHNSTSHAPSPPTGSYGANNPFPAINTLQHPSISGVTGNPFGLSPSPSPVSSINVNVSPPLSSANLFDGGMTNNLSAIQIPPNASGPNPFGSLGAGSGPLVPGADQSDAAQDQKTQAFFRRLLLASEGVLYEDGNLQIGLKSEYQREQGRIMLFYGNSSISPLNNFRAAISPIAQVQTQLHQVPNSIAPKAQVQQLLTFVCTGEFTEPPVLQLSFVTPTRPVNLSIKLPIVVTKFTEQLRVSGPDFFNSWKQYTGKPYEIQDVFKAGRPIDLAWISKVLQDGFHLAVLKNVDPSINNLVAAGTFHASNGAQVVCLLRMETNPQANMCRLTIRTSSGSVSSALQSLIVTQLSSS